MSLFLNLGCSYDYSGLEGTRPHAAVGGTGGTTTAIQGTGTGGHIVTTSGSGGAVGPHGSGGITGTPDGPGGGAGNEGGASASGGAGVDGGVTATGGGGNPAATGGSSAGRNGAINTGGSAGSGLGGQASGGAGGSPVVGGTGGGVIRVLSVDFVGAKPLADETLTDLTALKPTDVAGVKQVARWNSARDAMGSLPTLTLADGTLTTASVTWNAPLSATARGTWWCGFADEPGDIRMMNGYLDPHSAITPQAPATVVVANLPATIAAAGYDVYVYVQGDLPAGAVRTAVYSIGTSAFTVTGTGPSPAMFPGYRLVPPPAGTGNTLVFRNLLGTSFTLLATPGSGGRAPVNGMQIVSPAGR